MPSGCSRRSCPTAPQGRAAAWWWCPTATARWRATWCSAMPGGCAPTGGLSTSSAPGSRRRTCSWFTARLSRDRALRASLYFNDALDLDRDVVRQRAHADRGARMLAAIAEDFDEEV